jgi:protease-4
MWQFIKQTFASAIGTIIGLTLFFTIGFSSLIVLLIIGTGGQSEPVVKDKSVLIFDLSINITDTEPPSTFAEALAGENSSTIPLRQVITAIENATQDNKITAILLDGRKTGLGNGYANLKEVRDSLLAFKNAGKKIIAYDVDINESEYYLMSLADEIIMNPVGAIALNGFSTQQMFLSGALEKYGLGVQVVKVGEYKGAVEPFIRENFSPENKEQTRLLLTDIWQDYKEIITQDRDNLTPNNIQNIADNQGFLTAQQALENNLVDRLAHWDEVVTDLQDITAKDQDSFNQISLNSYRNILPKTQIFSNQKIALVYAEGTIVNGLGNPDQIGGDRLAEELRKIRKDNAIQAVVLRINSPGGSATASEIITRELELINKEKPVIISMGNVAASGGYWLATGGNYIFAENSTITGSIGVFGVLFNIQQIAENNGITWDEVKTGEFADFQTITRPKNDLELAHYQTSVNQIYDLFLAKVSQSRNIAPNQLQSLAQGRIWSGKTAQKMGLVDEIGGLNQAIAFAATKANLGENWQLEEYPQRRTFEQQLIENLFRTSIGQYLISNQPTLPQELQQIQRDLTMIKNFNDPRNIYSKLFFNFKWD